MFGVVSSGVDDDCRVCKVVFLYVLESTLKCESQMFCDFVLCLWFVVVFVNLVHCSLYVCCLCVSVVAVMPDVEFGAIVVVVVVVVVSIDVRVG